MQKKYIHNFTQGIPIYKGVDLDEKKESGYSIFTNYIIKYNIKYLN